MCNSVHPGLLEQYIIWPVWASAHSDLDLHFGKVLTKAFEPSDELWRFWSRWTDTKTDLNMTVHKFKLAWTGSYNHSVVFDFYVGFDACCQSRGCEFEPQLGQYTSRRLTMVIVTSVIRLPPMAYQSMWKSSLLLGRNADVLVWESKETYE